MRFRVQNKKKIKNQPMLVTALFFQCVSFTFSVLSGFILVGGPAVGMLTAACFNLASGSLTADHCVQLVAY